MHFLDRITLIILAALTVGCANPAGSGKPPVTTVKWDVLNGAYRFSTNDAANYGFSYWYPLANSDPNAVFTSMTGVAQRISGATNQGFGFLFCYVDTNNFYKIVIDSQGYYRISEKYAGAYYTILDWTSTTALLQGLTVKNTVQVTRSSGNVFSITINGTLVTTFTSSLFSFDGFAAYASIGDATNEQFPGVAQDVRISFTAPSTLPGAGKSVSPGAYQRLVAETAPDQANRRP